MKMINNRSTICYSWQECVKVYRRMSGTKRSEAEWSGMKRNEAVWNGLKRKLFLNDRMFYLICTVEVRTARWTVSFLDEKQGVARGYLTFALSVWSWGPRPTSNIDGIIADNLRRRLLRVLHFSHPSLVSHVRPLVLQLSCPLLPTSSSHYSSLPHFARREGTAFCSQLRNLAIARIIYMRL